MNSAVAVQNGNLAVVQPDFTATQIDLIAHTIGFAPGTAEFDLFMNLCRAKRLDPLTRQIYGIKTSKGLQMFASIDGLRVIAQRSGQYAGQVGPFWCGEDGKWQDVWLSAGKPAAAKIGVLRKGWTEPMWGVATLKSYGKSSPTWDAMPDVMLAKVAESMALRKAFPDDLSALYVREEFGEAETPEPPVNAATAPVRAHTAAPVVEVVNAETGEIEPIKGGPAEQKKIVLGQAIKELRTELGWDAERVRVEAERQKISLNSVAGLTKMVDILEDYVDLAKAEGADQYDDEEDYEGIEAQGTLLDADTVPIEREY